MSERGISLRTLATAAHVDPGHLSRVLRSKRYKTPSGDLARRVAVALDLPEDFFPEYREALVIGRIRDNPDLRDRLYVCLSRSDENTAALFEQMHPRPIRSQHEATLP